MAPALTEASDPQTFHVAARHHHSSSGRSGQSPSGRSSSPPATHLALQYGGLKEPHDCTDAHLAAALANCSRRTPRPPGAGGLACGREGCDPPPRPHATHTTMDPSSGLPPPCETDSSTTTTHQENSEAATMGQEKPPDTMAPHKSPRPPSHDGDLLALIGRDFPNMNEIIDTLTRLADNPEVLAAVDTASLTLTPTQPLPEVATGTEVVQPHEQQQQQQQQEDVPKEERARILVEELGRRQWLLERRQARLQRRLRRVTSRGLSATVSGQLRDLLDYGHTVLAKQRQQQTPQVDGATTPTPPEVNLDTLRADTMRSMSTTALVNLVRRVEASQGLGSTPHRPSRTKQPPIPSPALPEHSRMEVNAVVAEMQAATHAHTHHDSDATETSSGGESCDELEGFPEANTNYIAVQERAFARYCRARAWVASRWTWLQAQIADLEYRILQQHKIYSHIRNTKGAVQVEETSRWKGVAIRDPAHLDLHDPALTCLAAPTNRTALNGYHSRVEEGGLGGGGVGECGTGNSSARTQGIRAVKRRRLVRAGAGLCAGYRRGGSSGRIPAVQCKCVPPLSCVLCTRLQGVPPPTAPPDPYTQPTSERHARVDPTYHPVLSQPADVSLSAKFDVMLKTMDWQKQALTTKTPQLKSVRENVCVEKKKKSKDKDKDSKKDHKKHKKDSKGRITLKLKKSLFTTEVTKDGEHKRKKSTSQEPIWSPVPLSSSVLSSVPAKKVRLEEDDDSSSVYGSSLHSSPSASPAPIDRSALKRHSTSNQKNKQSSNSYDIDNIVIPHSMAASTRVEKLEYKEIPTPKWRIVPRFPNNVHSSKSASQEDEFQMEEDVSEEAVIARHNRSEEMERKKFLQYLHMQVTTRSSRSRRTDSSGTNTPDHPLSPRPPDPASDTISPLATPPTTPLAPSEDSNQSSSLPTVASIPSSSCTTSGTTSSTFTTVATQAGLSTTTTQPSQQPHQHQPSQLLIHNSQISSNSILSHLPTTTSVSTASSISTSVSTLSSSTPSSLSTFSSLLPGTRRNRTFSSSSITKSKVSAGVEEGVSERLEGITPYEQRVFPLNDAELMLITRETEDCDIGPPSPPFDTTANNCGESGRSTPMSEVTDSAPEEDGEFDDTAAPKWTISGLKDATGQCVLQVHRN